MKTMTLEEFQTALKAQGVPDIHMAVKCPMCGTVQSAMSLMLAGVSSDTVMGYIGFSCIGRWLGSPPPDKNKNRTTGCNWTLGGLFKLHQLEVVDTDGKRHPIFEPATPVEATALMSRIQPCDDMRDCGAKNT